MLDVGS
jgi:uncharacterized protein YeaO (DUF488 family)